MSTVQPTPEQCAIYEAELPDHSAVIDTYGVDDQTRRRHLEALEDLLDNPLSHPYCSPTPEGTTRRAWRIARPLTFLIGQASSADRGRWFRIRHRIGPMP